MSAVIVSSALVALSPASTQEPDAPAKPAASKTQPTRYVWTGTTIGADGARTTEPPIVAETSTGAGSKPVVTRASPRATADALLKELAAAQLSIDVDRKLDEAQAKLDELRVRASWKEGYVGRAEVLEKVALARSTLFETRGKREEAKRALEQLLPDETTKRALGARFELVPASADDLATESKALGATAVRDAAAKLTPGARAADRDAGSQGVESLVRVALGNCQLDVIRQLGRRAVPVLEKVVLENLEDLPASVQCDALTVLLDQSEGRGAELVLAQLDRGGFLWKKRVLRAMGNTDVFDHAWMYSSDVHAKPTLVEPVWSTILERLLGDADVGIDALRKLVGFAANDALTPPMQSALERAIGEGDTEAQQAAMDVLRFAPGRDTTRPVLESALGSSRTTVRRFAAQMLLEERRSVALLAHADDPDAEVRRTVVRSMRERTIRVPYYDGNQATNNTVNARPTLGDEERSALQKLVRDADPDVRREAVWVILPLERPLDPDVYVRLATEGDAETRKALAKLPITNPALPAVLERLAVDASPDVRAAYDLAITQVALQTSVLDFAPYLEGFLARVASARPPGTDPTGGVRDLLDAATRSALRHPAGMRRLLEVARRPEAEWLVKQISSSFPWPRKEEGEDLDPVLHAVDDASQEALVRRVHALYGGRLGTFAEGALRAARLGVVQREAWRSILVDASAERSLRVLAAGVACVAADAGIEDGIRALFGDASWSSRSVQDVEKTPLGQIGRSFPLARRPAFFLGLIQDGRVMDAPLQFVLARVSEAPDMSVWSMAILDRWLDGPTSEPVVENLLRAAFQRLPASEDAKTVAMLREGLRSELANDAAFAIARMKRPAHVELLVEALDASWIADRSLRATVQQAAIAGLTSRMDEWAAEKLLGAVTLAVNDATRKAALEGLEQIRKYLDEKKRWELRDTDLEKREAAVRELLVLLADVDATTRAQAAKSLATLDAVGELPRLVLLLKDKSPEVRAAAQQAIDQLNAKSAKAK